MIDTIDFRIVWEALTTCPGTCSGCNITKKTNLEDGLWTDMQLKTVVRHTKQFLRSKKYDQQKIFLTAGDYLYLPDNEMVKILDAVNETMDKDISSRVVLFTTSGIGKPEFLQQQVDKIQKLLLERNLECFPEIIFDFAKLKHKKYWPTYINNIKILSTAFPLSAINIQVGKDTFHHNMTPEALHEFIEECNVCRVEFVMSPHEGNAGIINEVWDETMEFLKKTIQTLDLNNKSYTHPQILTIQSNLQLIPEIGTVSIKDEIQAATQSYQKDSIFIANNGDLSLFFSGISNIYPLAYAKPASVNIFKKMYVSIERDSLVKESVLFNNKVSSQNKCLTCKYQKNCHSMGHMLLTKTLDRYDFDKCPLGIYDYLEFILKLENVQNIHYEKLPTINLNYKSELSQASKLSNVDD